MAFGAFMILWHTRRLTDTGFFLFLGIAALAAGGLDLVHTALTVALAQDGAAITLTVADNGVGLPAALDWTTAPTLGLRLVRMLRQHQLGGQVTVDRTTGTRVQLQFASGKEG